MGIIACPECKGQLSDQAPGCPHCGYVAKPPPAPAKPSPILKLVGYFKSDVSRFWRECKLSLGTLARMMLVTMVVGVIIGIIIEESLRLETLVKVLTFIKKEVSVQGKMVFFENFRHKLTIALMTLGAGLWLRHLPAFIIGVNVLVTGFIVGVAPGIVGVRGTIFAISILFPQGIFELPALIGSGVLALRVNGWKRIAPDEKVQAEDVRWIARCFGYIVILLVVAATIRAALIAGVSPPRAP
jgi:uncharacterized membrane protein SpoIIM required for sporulation